MYDRLINQHREIAMKKTVYASFDYLFIKFEVDTERAAAIYSRTDGDCIFYVFDADIDEQAFLSVQKKFYSDYNINAVADSSYDTQRRYYKSDEEFNARRTALIQHLIEDLNTYDDLRVYQY